jgi:hypothetical protein
LSELPSRARPRGPAPTNDDIAAALDRLADLLEVQHANGFRVRAYRNAATSARTLGQPLADLVAAEGLEGLERLPSIGKSIASTIRELVVTGRVPMLDRLEGQVSPEDLLATVPGIGEKLAHRIHDDLGVETLEELELAAHDGRLEQVPGLGHRKAQGLRDILAAMLSRSTRRHARHPTVSGAHGGAEDPVPAPSVGEVLSVDDEYRARAAAGKLRKIAPRRFNPEGKAWLPVLHTERGHHAYTALFSNTRRAHELAMTDDWVVIFYEVDGHENQCTVVTERRGPLEGERVVRGREDECRAYYTTGIS